MKITNRYNLPQEIVNAVRNDKYSKGSSYISATGLLAPVRKTILSRRHSGEIVEDVSDKIWVLIGKSLHLVLEQTDSSNALKEERLSVEIFGKKVSGSFDFYKDGIVTDYKTMSAWSRVYGSRDEEWEQQLNIYAYLLRKSGFDVIGLRILAVYRDWDKFKVNDSNYPKSQAEIIEMQLWTEERQREFIEGKLQKLLDADKEEILDNDLPECSPDEMWETKEKFALMKKGAKKAIKLFDTSEEIPDYMEKFEEKERKNYFKEHRPGERKRCDNYCEVNYFCNQYKKYKQEKAK